MTKRTILATCSRPCLTRLTRITAASRLYLLNLMHLLLLNIIIIIIAACILYMQRVSVVVTEEMILYECHRWCMHILSFNLVSIKTEGVVCQIPNLLAHKFWQSSFFGPGYIFFSSIRVSVYLVFATVRNDSYHSLCLLEPSPNFPPKVLKMRT